jgi:hypothetical protein
MPLAGVSMWHMSTVGWPAHAVEGVTVERLDGWRRILAIRNGSPSKLAP